MSGPATVTIIGGGLAGLAAGIVLRQRDVPVVLWEADHYPRHRVCGEFISGRGRQILAALGLDPLLRDAGAREALTARFHSRTVSGPVWRLPAPALCISRFALDAALAGEFRSLGGVLREGERHASPEPREGVVLATGRRPNTRAARWRWFGVKTHARGVNLGAHLEMHLLPDGYVGICRLGPDLVNVCGLFRRARGSKVPACGAEMLRGVPGSALHRSLVEAEFLPETTRAVGGLDLLPRVADPNECRIGDALTMIPPFTGNGMSMALESAEQATEPLERWSRGGTGWDEARVEIGGRCDRVFKRRLRWADRLHAAMLCGPLQTAIAAWLPRVAQPWEYLYSRTR